MKNRVFAMLFLSATFALALFAQAPTAGSNAQPSAQNVDSICKEPLEPASHEGFWDEGEEPNLGNLIGHGFYRKNDVQKQTTPIKTCLDELSATATSQTKAIKDADLKAQQIVALASAKSNEADQHAIDAGNRAQAAQQAATQASARIATVEQLVGTAGQYQGGTETEIQFRPGQSVLSKSAKDALDQLAGPLKDRGNYVIEVRGFSYRPRPGRDCRLAEDGRLGCPLLDPQSSDPSPSHLRSGDGQYANGRQRRKHRKEKGWSPSRN